jgi:hypothetical protein
MGIDISIFDEIKEKSSIHIVDDLNFWAYKVLYDNCIRMGSDNSNVSYATIHPSLWFNDIIDYINKVAKIVTEAPSFSILKIDDNLEVIARNYMVESFRFDSDEDFKIFFTQTSKYKSLALFSIVKYLDLRTLKVSWSIRSCDITTIEENRDKKIDDIINI